MKRLLGFLLAAALPGALAVAAPAPAYTTVPTGNASLPAGNFEASIGGLTPGNGNGFHTEYYVVAGTLTVVSGTTLVVHQWVGSDGITPFELQRKEVVSLLRATNGITGTFQAIQSPDFPHWVLFDDSTSTTHRYGNLYGTGLLSAQTFADYGSNARRRAVGQGLWDAAVRVSTAGKAGFIDSATAPGQAAIGLLAATNLDTALDSLSPEPYLSLGDYGLFALRGAADGIGSGVPFLQKHHWTASLAYQRAGVTEAGLTSSAFDHRMTAALTVVRLACDFTPGVTGSVFYGASSGHVSSAMATSDLRGSFFGVEFAVRPITDVPLSLRLSAVHAGLHADTTRQPNAMGLSGGQIAVVSQAASSAAAQPVSGFATAFTVRYDLCDGPRWKLGPYATYFHGNSKTDAVTETGGGASLDVAGAERSLSSGDVGLAASFASADGWNVNAAVGYEKVFSSTAPQVSATFVGGATGAAPMTLTGTAADGHVVVARLGLGYAFDRFSGVALDFGLRSGDQLKAERRLGFSYATRF